MKTVYIKYVTKKNAIRQLPVLSFWFYLGGRAHKIGVYKQLRNEEDDQHA